MKELCNYCSHEQDYVAECFLNARTCREKNCMHYSASNSHGCVSYFKVSSSSQAVEELFSKFEKLELKVWALQYQLDTGEKPE